MTEMGIRLGEREVVVADDRYVDVLLTLFENKQTWIRHYESMLAGVNTLGITVVLGTLAVITQSGAEEGWYYFLLPFLLSFMGIYLNAWCSVEIRNLFLQIVVIEECFKLYELRSQGANLLDPAYRNSATRERTIILFGLAAYVLTLLASILLGALFWTGQIA